MTITFNPTNLELTEFVGTTGTTVSLSADAASSFWVYSATASENPSDLVITTTPSSFSFTSTFADMFDRTIKYTSQNSAGVKSFGSVSRFVDLPSDYKGMYQYIPPSVEFKNIVFTVGIYEYTGEVDPLNPELPIDPTPPWGTNSPVGNPAYDSYKTNLTWTLVLRQNWQSSNAALKLAVKNGSGYKAAAAKYPEMEL